MKFLSHFAVSLAISLFFDILAKCLVVAHDVSAHPTGGLTKRVGSLSAEQNRGHTQPGCVGHEREAVLRRHRDQSVGRGLLRSAETVSGGSAQVSHKTHTSFHGSYLKTAA